MGAFVAAAESGVAVVPVAIRGTRAILSDESKFPFHGAVQVIVENSLKPQGNDWAEATRLRSEARAAIARHCGEKTL
jgi:1-acyl-sn-glycerol-3-phosphate acyltransferase